MKMHANSGRSRRNAHVADRRGLEIDPGEVVLKVPGAVDLVDQHTNAPINSLGRATMEPDGRLVFLSAFGEAAHTSDAKPIDEYANNDGWFDDMSDGQIRAFVTFADGHTEEAEPAWVLVGPPDFAPGIGNAVSLYDTLWDLAVRHKLPCQAGDDSVLQDLVAQQRAWQDATNDFAPSYEPSFSEHVYPILARAVAARDVHEPPPGREDYHGSLPDWTRLAKRDENQICRGIFKRIRNPSSDKLERLSMPRGHGDDYTSLDEFESELSEEEPSPHAFLSFTRVQYALLKAWAEGRFKEDWTGGDVKCASIPSPGPITPHGLDRAALENCVGGPFYPGIEVSWLVPSKISNSRSVVEPRVAFAEPPLKFQWSLDRGGHVREQPAGERWTEQILVVVDQWGQRGGHRRLCRPVRCRQQRYAPRDGSRIHLTPSFDCGSTVRLRKCAIVP
jgi:hypothetical protein